MHLPSLPISSSLYEIKSALSTSSAVLTAPPGSGKTTIVPLALLDEPWLEGKKIIILQPRRIAARAACFRMSSLLNESPGTTVGYHIRHDRLITNKTRIEVVTEGILTRKLQSTPDLPGVGLIIFDEFHERSIHADLALALCQDLIQINDQLKLLIMSATLDVAPIAALLGNIPAIKGVGTSHPVQIDHHNNSLDTNICKVAVNGILNVIQERAGDILVFLPGVADISVTEKFLRQTTAGAKLTIQPLYGNLSQKEQDAILHPKSSTKRRVVLATSIAETSLTIEGIVNVIDSGWCKRPYFNPTNGLTTLKTMRISKSSADQRAGRAGRLGPGYCLRLWDINTQHSLPGFHPPEVLTSDLSSLALELLMWGVDSPDDLNWLNPPRESNYNKALSLLRNLSAVDTNNKLTDLGKSIAQLPLHPRLGRLLAKSNERGQQKIGADICALLSERDIIDYRDQSTVELSVRLDLLKQFRTEQYQHHVQIHYRADLCKRVDRTARQFLNSTNSVTAEQPPLSPASLLLSAYPDRLAQRLSGSQRGRYKLTSGRIVCLSPEDPLNHSDYLVVANVDGGKKQGRIYLAEPIDISSILSEHTDLIETSELVYWDIKREKVITLSCKKIGTLTLAETNLAGVDDELILNIVIEAIPAIGLANLLTAPKVIQLQTKVLLAKNNMPHWEWPDLSTETREKNLGWLTPYLLGVRTLRQLQQLKFHDILLAQIDYKLQQKLHREMPDFFQVPTGSKIRIQYNQDSGPILAVRIQELFGLQNSPSICNGKLPLTLHLLSPAQRPIQITSDLMSFWENSYHEVKKDLKGRYPRHYWPDDPLVAVPTKYTKKKMIK